MHWSSLGPFLKALITIKQLKKLIVLSLAPKKLRVAEFPGNFGSLSIQKDIYYLYNLEIKDILLS